MISDALNLHVYPVRTEITATKQIPVLSLCSTYKSELKEFIVDENLLQVCSHFISAKKEQQLQELR